MATFNDRKNQAWRIQLDAPMIESIKSAHGVELVNLESDPLQAIRFDPLKLVAVIYNICEEQITERGLSPIEFGKLLPIPPDSMVDALTEAIIDFFPTGRASHVRGVLARCETMAVKAGEIAIENMDSLMSNKRMTDRIGKRASMEIDAKMNEMFPE